MLIKMLNFPNFVHDHEDFVSVMSFDNDFVPQSS